ncbi:acyltransferase family protein [Kaistia dalseonensis]|uniref:Membrane protein YcfT n=1 Tax=Kaistia dalseonensis TaxID=410840 RepID=A0ABU0H1P9_9HYPH|nr:acyltransferase family protein [Kaistia dalseonensis]MCX5493673.1 acyltransferase family protein [Kaistia dalseonensis]MDQ0436235.1 putative membrane protein YcfT [Kaistia dalseonensis]
MASISAERPRIDWVDYAKGFCIIMVVMMHSTLGVEKAAGAEGWMTYVVAFAKPFRMPDFFMISGLFLAQVIDRDWRSYADRKIVHFAYFYILWLIIQFAFKAPGMIAEDGAIEAFRQFALAFVDPFGTLWFIYLLPIFFAVTKLLRRVPWWIVWLAAAALEIAPIETGWVVPDEFASRFVYFYSGYVFAPHIFRLAASVIARPWVAAAGLVLWAIVEYLAVFGGYSELPFASLALGLAGAGAVVSFSALLSKAHAMRALRYCGQNSIVIYLAFFLPMAVTRTILLRTGIIADLGWVSLIVTAVAATTPILFFWLVRGTRLRFLFERPAWARLAPSRATLAPAE